VRALLLLTALVSALPAPAANVLDYYAMSLPRAWLATDPKDLATGERITRHQACGGLTVFHHLKGAARTPWSSESFYLEDGWLRAMVEIGYAYTDGRIENYRTFRDVLRLELGIPWLPEELDEMGRSWQTPLYLEEYWTDEAGKPQCANTTHHDLKGSLRGMVASFETLHEWVQDLRRGSRDRKKRYDVETVRVERDWSVDREIYWYGRWKNPRTGVTEGLGLVRFQHWCLDGEKPHMATERTFQYLLESRAPTLPPCATCPLEQAAAP